MIKTVKQTKDPTQVRGERRGGIRHAGVSVSFLVTWLFCEVLSSSAALHLTSKEAEFCSIEFSGQVGNSFQIQHLSWESPVLCDFCPEHSLPWDSSSAEEWQGNPSWSKQKQPTAAQSPFSKSQPHLDTTIKGFIQQSKVTAWPLYFQDIRLWEAYF